MAATPKPQAKPEAKPASKPVSKPAPVKKAATRGPDLEPHQIILRPLVTEKGTHQSTNEHHNAYSFEVNPWADKLQIKKAVEDLFNVRVEAVRTQNRMGKSRRYRFRVGKLPNWKKAIVKLHKEDRIEFF